MNAQDDVTQCALIFLSIGSMLLTSLNKPASYMNRILINGIVLVNLLKPTGHVMHKQFNIQQLYVLPTLYLCVLYLSENKQRLVPPTA